MTKLAILVVASDAFLGFLFKEVVSIPHYTAIPKARRFYARLCGNNTELYFRFHRGQPELKR